MILYIVFYINFYFTSYPTYVEPEYKQAQFMDKWEAVEFKNRAIEGGCDSVRMDSIFSDNTNFKLKKNGITVHINNR